MTPHTEYGIRDHRGHVRPLGTTFLGLAVEHLDHARRAARTCHDPEPTLVRREITEWAQVRTAVVEVTP